MARAPPWHGGGCGFKSHPVHQPLLIKSSSKAPKFHFCRLDAVEGKIKRFIILLGYSILRYWILEKKF